MRARAETLTRPSSLAGVASAVGRAPYTNIGGRRSYSDIGLPNRSLALDHCGRRRIIDWNPAVARITVEAGMRLADLCAVTIRGGQLPSVLPGTGFVTVGGAVASDVHGKNHTLRGSFGNHVRQIRLQRSDLGETVAVPDDQLLRASVGGLGLSGAITDVTLELQNVGSAYLDQDAAPLPQFADYAQDLPYLDGYEFSAAWIDMTDPRGGGVVFKARWRCDGDFNAPARREATIPVTAPLSCINAVTTSLFNVAYRRRAARRGSERIHYTRALWPLDGVLNWNRLYGPSGFEQYQVCTPDIEPLVEVCRLARRSGLSSPLTVLKRFGGRAPVGMISFPRKGFTLAIDFRPGRELAKTFAAMDEVVRAAGGAWYPAKYQRLRRSDLERAFPAWSEVLAMRDPMIRTGFLERMTS
nr:FAD-binding oxidoreductase [Caulobacter sp. CCH5-E12]